MEARSRVAAAVDHRLEDFDEGLDFVPWMRRSRLRRTRPSRGGHRRRGGHLARAGRALPGAASRGWTRAERVPDRDRRARAGRRRPGRRPARRRRRAPAARRADRRQGHQDVAGEVTASGTPPTAAPARRHRGRRRLRAAGAVIIGKTNLPELAIMRLHRDPRLRRHAQPVGHRTARPAAQRRQRRRGRGRAVRGGAPAPTAPARSASRPPHCGLSASSRSATASRSAPTRRALARPERHRLPDAHGRRHRAAASTWPPHGRREPYARRSGAPPGRLRIGTVDQDAVPAGAASTARCTPRSRDVAECLRGLGHEVVERDPDYGRAGDALLPRYLGGIAQDAGGWRGRSASSGGRAASRASAGWCRSALLDRALRDEADHAARLSELFGDTTCC